MCIRDRPATASVYKIDLRAAPSPLTAHSHRNASRHRPFHGLIGPWLSRAIMSASATCVCTRDSPDGRHGDHPLGAGWMDFSRSLDFLLLWYRAGCTCTSLARWPHSPPPWECGQHARQVGSKPSRSQIKRKSTAHVCTVTAYREDDQVGRVRRIDFIVLCRLVV